MSMHNDGFYRKAILGKIEVHEGSDRYRQDEGVVAEITLQSRDGFISLDLVGQTKEGVTPVVKIDRMYKSELRKLGRILLAMGKE